MAERVKLTEAVRALLEKLPRRSTPYLVQGADKSTALEAHDLGLVAALETDTYVAVSLTDAGRSALAPQENDRG